MARTTYKLHLRDPRHLLIAPKADPFADDEPTLTGQAGIERVVRQLGLFGVLPLERIQVHVTRRAPTGTTAAELQRALRRYCQVKLDDNERHLTRLKTSGRIGLLVGVLFLVAASSIAAAISSPLFEQWPDFVRRVLSEGFTIVGWVALWNPFEELVYAPIAARRERTIYRRLLKVRIELKRDR